MIEVIIASTIITLSMIAATAVAQKSMYVSRQATHTTQASFLLEEGAEVVRIMRDNNWTNISGLTVGTSYYAAFSAGAWSFSTTPSTIGDFTRTVQIANVNRDNTTKDISVSGTNDIGTKLVTVTVTWKEGGTTISKTLSFYILDIF